MKLLCVLYFSKKQSLESLLHSPDGFGIDMGRDDFPFSLLLVFLIGGPPPRRETTHASAGWEDRFFVFWWDRGCRGSRGGGRGGTAGGVTLLSFDGKISKYI